MIQNPDQYLTEIDREALETKGVRSRAKAISEFLKLAQQLGLDDERVAPIVEGIRAADSKEWKKLRKSLGGISAFLTDIKPIDDKTDYFVYSTPVAEVLVEIQELEAEEPDVVQSLESIADTVLEETDDVETEPKTEIGKTGFAIITRLTGVKVSSVDQLSETDIETIISHIAASTLSGKLIDETADKLRTLFVADSYSGVPNGALTIGNLRTSIMNNNATEKLAAALLNIKEDNQHIVETESVVSETLLEALPSLAAQVTDSMQQTAVAKPTSISATPRPPATRPVYVTDAKLPAQSPEIQTEKEKRERSEILADSLEYPEIVNRKEWNTAAFEELSEAAEGILTEQQLADLWNWIHFDEEGNSPSEITDVGREALKVLQTRFLSVNNGYFADRPRQNVAIRTLTVTANGIKTLPEVCAKIRALKPIDPKLSDTVAQRHVVAAVTRLLKNEAA